MSRAHISDAMQAVESRYEDLFAHCDQAIFIAAETILAVNDAAVGLFGATQAGQLVGRPLADFVSVPEMDGGAGRGGGAAAGGSNGSDGGVRTAVDARLKRLDRATLAVRALALPCRFKGRDARQI